MSMKAYEENMLMPEIYTKLAAGEEQIQDGKVLDAFEALRKLRTKPNMVQGIIKTNGTNGICTKGHSKTNILL